jgi:hypothetical protein
MNGVEFLSIIGQVQCVGEVEEALWVWEAAVAAVEQAVN